jgi:hypothetical protein
MLPGQPEDIVGIAHTPDGGKRAIEAEIQPAHLDAVAPGLANLLRRADRHLFGELGEDQAGH